MRRLLVRCLWIALGTLGAAAGCGGSQGNGDMVDGLRESQDSQTQGTPFGECPSGDCRPAGTGASELDVTHEDGWLPDLGRSDDTIEEGREEQGTVPRGTKELGEECSNDSECASGFCWASADASGCTIECESQAECQALGLVCSVVGTRWGCVPPPSAGRACAGHQDCVFPTVCIGQYNWCDLPECTLDGDCPVGEICNTLVRKCQPIQCKSTFECANPMEYCIGGVCGPPECTTTAECEQGQVCSPAQGICVEGTPCTDKCNFYHQVCINGLCEYDLCATGCTKAGHVCNPKTGKCGPPCTTNAECPVGWGCDESAGVCYENIPPFAAATVKDGDQGKQAALVKAGSTVQLSAEGSVDPEGFGLEYSWMILSMPAGATQTQGSVFCQQEECSLGPLSQGIYQVGLWVTDEVGAVSTNAVVGIEVK